ncbi:uncharacterized protein LOC120429752 [Culex pipiens pallens]|uniref:uncharacterized protein LOC120429752 n=1 Tax=Culex pipiens pallens TaxID=42434 RepID=UPI001953412E|nr:uncharacterized protein LOC120429752 [Culex pipiens pallens]
MTDLQRTTSTTISSGNDWDSLEQNNNNNNEDVIAGCHEEEAREEVEGAVGGTVFQGLDPNLPIPTEQDWTDEELDRDPHRMFFYDAYRSIPSTPELDESGGSLDQIPMEQRPLALMDDLELWDHMDDDQLKKHLQHHPVLLEKITRNRKRRAAALEDTTDEDADLCAVMERHAKVTKFNEHTTVC